MRYWLLIFAKTRRWYSPLCPVYSHVSALGFSDDGWLYVDPERCGSTVEVMGYDGAMSLLSDLSEDCDFVLWPHRERGRFFWPLTCVSTICHLTGAPGALLPIGLFRRVLREGGTIHDRTQLGSEAQEAAGSPA